MEDITERIVEIQEEYNLTPSLFADEIGVQRSSISHILSGRNKPSLDFIQKILLRFPEIDPGWLLSGKGQMKQLNLFGEEDPAPPSSTINQADQLKDQLEALKEELKKSLISEIKPVEKPPVPPVVVPTQEEKPEPVKPAPKPTTEPAQMAAAMTAADPSGKRIERIMIFYSDKTFSVYTPE